MRIADPRIRVVARAINDWSSESLHPIATRTPFGFTGQAQRRGINRRADIRAAVRVLTALDATHGIPGLTDDEADRYADAIQEGR